MVLAAGLGTRMRPLTDTRPKALIEVAGRPLIDHALDRVAAAGIGTAVVNLHYLADMLRAHLAGRRRPRVVFSEERPQLLETGGGIVQALPLLGPAPFVVLNSDAVWGGTDPLGPLLAAWDPARMDALLLLVARGAARGYSRPGDFFLDVEGGRPRRRGAAAEAPLVYTGAQMLHPRAFADAPAGAFSLNLIWDRLLGAGRLAAVVHHGPWVDVGTPAGIALAEAVVAGDG